MAIDYYETNALTDNNISLEDCYLLKQKFQNMYFRNKFLTGKGRLCTTFTSIWGLQLFLDVFRHFFSCKPHSIPDKYFWSKLFFNVPSLAAISLALSSSIFNVIGRSEMTATFYCRISLYNWEESVYNNCILYL